MIVDFENGTNPFKRSETFPANRPTSTNSNQNEIILSQESLGSGIDQSELRNETLKDRAYIGSRTKPTDVIQGNDNDINRLSSNLVVESKEDPIVQPCATRNNAYLPVRDDIDSKLDRSLMLALENERLNELNPQQESSKESLCGVVQNEVINGVHQKIVDDNQRATPRDMQPEIISDNSKDKRIESPVNRRPILPMEISRQIPNTSPTENNYTNHIETSPDTIKYTSNMNHIDAPEKLPTYTPTVKSIVDIIPKSPPASPNSNRITPAHSKSYVDTPPPKSDQREPSRKTHKDSPLVSSITSSHNTPRDQSRSFTSNSSFDGQRSSPVSPGSGFAPRSVEMRRKTRTEESPEQESFSSRIAKVK